MHGKSRAETRHLLCERKVAESSFLADNRLPSGSLSMRSISFAGIVVALVLGFACGARGEVTAAQVNLAIARGVAFLEQHQKPGGQWTEYSTEPDGGQTALLTLALLRSGRTMSDPSVAKALDYLERLRDPEKTYSASL